MAVRTAALLLAAMVFVSRAAANGSMPAAAPATADGHQQGQAATTLTREAMLTTEWRLFSSAISVMPFAGYPILFRDDGTVATKNLGLMTHWTLRDGGLLELKHSDGTVGYELRYDSAKRMFFYVYESGSIKGGVVLIGPVGSDFTSYQVPTRR